MAAVVVVVTYYHVPVLQHSSYCSSCCHFDSNRHFHLYGAYLAWGCRTITYDMVLEVRDDRLEGIVLAACYFLSTVWLLLSCLTLLSPTSLLQG
jgi:hypothetical protein